MNLSHPSHFAAALRGRQPVVSELHIRILQGKIISTLDDLRRKVAKYDSEFVSEGEWLTVKGKGSK